LTEEEEDTFIPKNMYIIKPGENTNRGNGIIVCHTLQEIKQILSSCSHSEKSSSMADKVADEKKRTFIVQRYIDRPLLINRRKFDIRGYGLFTSTNGVQKGYFYEDGYLRMSSKEYNTNSTDVFIHLTNDAI
jgi:hypothetical protein